MSQPTPMLTVETAWCGTVTVMPNRWAHAVARHPEVAPYLDQVGLALEKPNLVYETSHVKPTRAFYARGLIDEPPFQGCYVAVFVRYTMASPQFWTAYLPSRLSPNPGTLIHAEK